MWFRVTARRADYTRNAKRHGAIRRNRDDSWYGSWGYFKPTRWCRFCPGFQPAIRHAFRPERYTEVLADLQQRIGSLCRACPSRDRRSRSKHRSRNSPHHNRSSSHSSQPGDVCWLHHRFGNDARRSLSPCKFETNSTYAKSEKSLG